MTIVTLLGSQAAVVVVLPGSSLSVSSASKSTAASVGDVGRVSRVPFVGVFVVVVSPPSTTAAAAAAERRCSFVSTLDTDSGAVWRCWVQQQVKLVIFFFGKRGSTKNIKNHTQKTIIINF